MRASCVFRSRWALWRSRWALWLLLLTACGPVWAQQAPPPAVTVATVAPREITPSVTFNGRIEATDKVDLRARVEGFLEQRLFEEGARVKAGDLLFVIEKAPYQAEIESVQAAIASAQATLDLAELERRRQEELVQRRATAQAVLDQAIATARQARAELQRQQAALTKAELNLSYTDIKAPIDGRIGRATVSVGDFVGPSSGALATIVRQDPIYVSFPVSSRQLLEAQKDAQAQGEDARAVRVRVRLPDGSLYDQTGTVNFVDNQVDPTTDTVTIRSELLNPNGRLIDGQLVGVIVEAAKPQMALTVPQAALLTDQAGSYVLVVNAENRVEQRRVQLGQAVGADIAVTAGLKEGEHVIVEGIQKVRPGQPVQVAQDGARP